jgi:hypothetical protein
MVEIRRMRVDEAPLVRQLVRTAIEELAERHPEDRIGISEGGLSNLCSAGRTVKISVRASTVRTDQMPKEVGAAVAAVIGVLGDLPREACCGLLTST